MKTPFLIFFIILHHFILAQEKTVDNDSKKIDSINTILSKNNLGYKKKIDNLFLLTDEYLIAHDHKNVLLLFLKTRQLAKKNNDTLTVGITYKGEAFILAHNKINDRVIELMKISIKLIESVSDENPLKKAHVLRANLLLAEFYSESNNYGKASNIILNSYDYLTEKEDSTSIYYRIDALNTLAYIYSEIENNAKALENLKEALKLETKMNDDIGRANTYNAIAIIHSKQKNETKALEYYQLSLDIHLKRKDTILTPVLYNNMGISYYEMKDYEKAKNLLLKSINLAKKFNQKKLLADSHLYLGKCYLAENKIDLGLLNISKSTAYSEKMASPSLMIENLLVKANVSNKYKNTSKALEFLNEALIISKKTETIDLKKRLYQNLAKTYETVDVSKSNFYTEKFKQIKDSIEHIQQKHKTDVLKAEFDNLKIKADLKNKDSELLLAYEREQASQTKFTLLIALTSLFIIASVIIILRQIKLHKTRKRMWLAQKEVLSLKQEKTASEILHKNQQITDFAIHITEKNDLLEKIKKQVKEIRITDKTSSIRMNDLIMQINDDITQNKEKAQLYSNIGESSDDFNNRIHTLHPNLSLKEKKIVTFIRLEHSSKQIAIQLNISPRSIDNYRVKLRKKMEVPKETRLLDYIKAI